MSEADKMFGELGYSKIEDETTITYVLNNDNWVEHFTFNLEYRNIETDMLDVCTAELCKAIYKKCEEMGWI